MRGRRAWRWARRILLGCAAAFLAVLAAIFVAVCGFSYDPDRLSPERGAPLLLTDRHGEPLRVVAGDGGRREAFVPLERVPSLALLTFVASEDDRFFEHRGVDLRGIARAAYLNLRERRIGYGGSTITMQLVRMVHSDGEPRTFKNKIREAVLAMRLERAMDKRAILEQYVNRAYFGNGAYGIEAAARTYFGKPAAALSPGEATLLAVIPRAPTAYDPLVNLPAALRRRDHVFSLLLARGLMTAEEAGRARAQPLPVAKRSPHFRAPHFTEWVLAELPEETRRRGGAVRTSLDLRLQEELERHVRDHVDERAGRRLEQAGVVVLDTATGEVLAMVGSADFAGPAGQVNIATWRRHPGSALKPFVFALALEHGDSPATIAYDAADVPSEYRVLSPREERGPVRYREALAGSYNLAAVHTLERVGVERLMSALRRAGVGPLDGPPGSYGLRLALGSARVGLLDLAAGYGFLTRGGRVVRPRAVLAIELAGGGRPGLAPPAETRVFSEETSWLVMDMLADPEARRPAFGMELPFDDLPFPVAVKTGTSRGFADTVTVAVTSEVTVAVWAGNFDGKPTHGLVAIDAAAPLARTALLLAAGERALTLPPPPATLVHAEVCPLSGERPSPDCPHRKLERFAPGTEPGATCDWHRRDESGRVLVVYPPELEPWARRRAALSPTLSRR